MTPNPLDYILTEKYAVELSSGRGLDRSELYGVSVVKRDGDEAVERMTELSECFPSKEDALRYIEENLV